MRENISESWLLVMSTVILATAIFAKLFQFKLRTEDKSKCRLPPGRRGWPLIGDSINWYNAVASSHPPQFVEEMVKRYIYYQFATTTKVLHILAFEIVEFG